MHGCLDVSTAFTLFYWWSVRDHYSKDGNFFKSTCIRKDKLIMALRRRYRKKSQTLMSVKLLHLRTPLNHNWLVVLLAPSFTLFPFSVSLFCSFFLSFFFLFSFLHLWLIMINVFFASAGDSLNHTTAEPLNNRCKQLTTLTNTNDNITI